MVDFSKSEKIKDSGKWINQTLTMDLEDISCSLSKEEVLQNLKYF